MPPEMGMLNFMNHLLKLTVLRTLMLAVGVGSVRRDIKIKNSDIEKSGLKPTAPETRSLNV